jgi:hypothetical protein
MIRLCVEAGLPEPEFRSEGERFITVIWRDWLTDKVIDQLGLNDRQRLIIPFLKSKRFINNSVYRTIGRATRKTATRDLEDLVHKGILVPKGSRRGAHYILAQKWQKKPTNQPTTPSQGNETFMGHLRHDSKPRTKRAKAKLTRKRPSRTTRRRKKT